LLSVKWACLSDNQLQYPLSLAGVAHAPALEEISEAFLE
jgi:hypothetical protein